ncbi:autotransporter-associated beta strand repeat-containing protein [Burkholderia guangdongensis]|uniref:autotransporter-associated beta strand repeat-containing protein n=1 Tax=Burkholderia guangdongensis TaxID=1792500 RepID=UPI0015CEA338|nr:autotransporter-associated beta strand repeat-containing protein [Burkholderia guangdongensis]
MNRRYRLVWNRSLGIVQVTSELARAPGSSSSTSTASAPRRRPVAWAATMLALACASAPAWSQVCTVSDSSGCGAPGGVGMRPTRSPDGGSGNGTGGDATVWNPNTSEMTGSAASSGNGGAGATAVFNVNSINSTSAGGSGGLVGATGSVGVNTSVTGGAGGSGTPAPAPAPSIVGGAGGGGGAGVFINDGNSAPIVSSSTTIAGGVGGAGGDAVASAANGNATNGDPGGGGGGGAGVIIGSGTGGVSLINSGRIQGGSGGAGGNGGYAGGGGGGGDGVLVLGAGASVTVAGGAVTGGAGGAPGTFQDGLNEVGGYGSGGAGVNLVGLSATLDNAGSITGGSAAVSSAGGAQSGTPGVGVRGWGGETVVTSGSIAGGSGNGQADSVLFSGGSNQLVITSGASFVGNIVSASGSVNGGDTLTLGGTSNGSIAADLIVGFANNTKTGSSTWMLTGAGNAGIDWTIQQGQLSGNSESFAGNLTFASNGGGTPSVDFDQTTPGVYAGVIGGAGAVVKDGAGTLTLTGANTYSGGTTVNAGMLQGDTTSLQGNIIDNAALVFNQNVNGTYAGAISGSGTVAITGPGTVTLTGANTYNGGTTISAGTLQGNTTSLQGNIIDNAALVFNQSSNGTYAGVISGTGTVAITGPGTVTLTGVNTYNGGTTISAGTLQGNTTSLQGNITDDAALVFNQSSNGTYAGVISGTGTVAITGPGTVTLTGANTYNGGTTINAGTLQGDTTSLQGNIIDNAALVFNQSGNGTYAGVISGSGTVAISGPGTVTLTGANTYNGGTTISAGTLQGDTTSLQGNIVDNAALIFNQSGNGTYAGAISGSGTVAISGPGTVTLTGPNTYNGGTMISAGTLQGDTTSLQGNITDNAALVFNQSGNGTYAGVISGSGTVAITGPGTVTLTGANTYNGGTTISAGTLQGDTTSLQGNIADNAALVFNQSSNGTYAGVISGSGTVAITGPGTVTLTGVNTYNGGTTISAGTLQGDTTSLQGNIADNAALVFNQSGNGTYAGAISGSGTVAISGPGTVTLTGANTYNGGTTISAGTLQGDTTSLQGNIADNAALVFNQSGNGTYAGTISGSGTVAITGPGTVTLTGASTYTGGTTIRGGTLAIGAGGSLASTGAMTLAASGSGFDISAAGNQTLGTLSGVTGTNVTLGANTLTLSHANGAFGGTIAGRGGVAVSGGAQTLSGANTYTGATAIGGGATLALSGSGGIAASSGVTDNGTFDISNTTIGASITNLAGAGTVALGSRQLTLTNAGGTFAGAFTGTGTLTLGPNSGALILNGNSSSFAGTTEVAGGLLEVGDIDTPSAVLGGNVVVDAGGTLRGHGTVGGNVSNAGTLAPGGSIGTLTVAGNYAQASGGTLAVEVSPNAASELKVGGGSALAGTLAISYDPGTYTARQYTLVSAGSVSGKFDRVTSAGTGYLGPLTQSVIYGPDTVALELAAPTPLQPVVVAPRDISIYTAMGTTAVLGAQAQEAALLAHAQQPGGGAPSAWITATGGQTKIGGTNGAPGFQAARYGFLAGIDQQRGDYTLGFAAGYDHADVDEQLTGDSGTTDTLRAALYGARRVGQVDLAATLGAGLDFLSQKRPFGAVGTAEGDHIGQEFNLGGQASVPLELGSVTVTPTLGLRFAYFHANGFGESGAGGQDLSVRTDNVRSLQPYAGVTLDKAFGDALTPVNVELRVAYAHELLSANRAVSVAAQDGTLFAAPGTSLPRGYLTAGASVAMHPGKNLTCSLSYDALINTTHASAQQASLNVAYRF